MGLLEELRGGLVELEEQEEREEVGWGGGGHVLVMMGWSESWSD